MGKNRIKEKTLKKYTSGTQQLQEPSNSGSMVLYMLNG